MTTKDALKAIGADAHWADEAQRVLCVIADRLDCLVDEGRDDEGDADLLGDIEKLTRSRPLQPAR